MLITLGQELKQQILYFNLLSLTLNQLSPTHPHIPTPPQQPN